MIRAILLAGGASSRFGSQKLLHPLPDGLTIGERSAKNLLEGAGNALAVVRPGADEVAERLARIGCEILFARTAIDGMGGSLAAAIAAASHSDGWIVALADMPFIAPATIAGVAQALQAGAGIAVPVLQGEYRRGHPVGFSARFGPALAFLQGDQGARQLLDEYHADVVQLAVEDAGIYRDIDVFSDIA